MPILEFKGKKPKIHSSCYISPYALIIGDVTIKKETSVWPNAVIRGDINKIIIGSKSNIQDQCTIHVDNKKHTSIGDSVIMGHGATAHACEIGNHVLIGIGSSVLDGAEIGDWVIVAAGSVVTEGSFIPSQTLVAGIPAKVKKNLDLSNKNRIEYWIKEYIKLGKAYHDNFG